MTHKTNLLNDLPSAATGEIFETLLQRPGVKLERIVSHGQSTPDGEWYDQEQDEWVMLLTGAARLTIEGKADLDLTAGDALLLPAHCRHRVAWTDPTRATVWLALHLGGMTKETA
ncbi:cupin domain-containing protein [Pelagibius sp. Alg239-R121]|uniref:cupin domain-containing protein n=1 Tax=Pelagibius sp. Alg239-R121 TaxID=2993448 RepID=UPI0024A6BB78|nr:cupin domain-containing protein [Pelagibius sp. Alg239-R121]